MEKKSKIKEQLLNALVGASFPILTQDELLGAFPYAEDGAICLAEGFLSVNKDEKHLLKPEHFPVATPEQAAELLLKIFGI